MNTKDGKALNREYQMKAVLIAIFISVFVLFVYLHSMGLLGQPGFQPDILDYVLLGLAAFRLGRMVAFDLIAEPLRAPFTVTEPDETGAGESVEPKGSGARRAMGQLLCCPICAGTWISALLVYFLYSFPMPARIFLTIIAAAATIEILNSLVEALSWSGQWNRTRSGDLMNERRKREHPYPVEWENTHDELEPRQEEKIFRR
jgi:hypothetical protein